MFLRQLKVILWKNYIIRKRHWCLLLFEALIPVSLFLLVAYGRSKITGLSKHEVVDVTYNEKFPLSYDYSGFNSGDTLLYYAPAGEFNDDIIHRVQVKFQILNNNIKAFSNEEALKASYARHGNWTVIAVVFNQQKNTSHLDYTLRYHKDFFSWDTEKLFENEISFTPGTGSRYLWEGFLALQMALDLSFMEREMEARGKPMPSINLEALEFPYPPHKADSGLSSLFMDFFPLITIFSFIFLCPTVLKRVVEEKYTGIKELMKMIGMKCSVLWCGWFIYSIVPMLFSVSLITLFLKVDIFSAGYPPIEFTDFSVLVLFLLLYCVASIMICFFMSSLFYKPTLATLVGLLVWILSYFVPKYMLAQPENRVPFNMKLALMLLPNMALHYGYVAMSEYEEREIGVQWSNWRIPGAGGANDITMFHVCIMFLFDSFIFMVLAWYIDQVRPGKYGLPKSVLFPIKDLYCKLRRNHVGNQNEPETYCLQRKNYSPKSIELLGVTKKYGKTTVVDNLSMEIGQNRITVLLGHNGAGKSTTMGMITGMIKKTSGRIIINGKEVNSRADIIDSIGLCPQHNLFFTDLTVTEHLKFFALLKGSSCQQAEREIEMRLEALGLTEKRDQWAHTLSGGMKRKLCLGMAVIGGSKILILDEPSSGMDIQSRRHMWDLLLQWRNERTILITTHFMEEADALADYIVIMDEGRLSSHGTPFDLKKQYETGYNLSLIIRKARDPNEVVDRIQREIRTHIDTVKCKEVNGHEVVFLIPSVGENINGKCQKLLEYLEANKDDFGIDSISLSNTTLEDVFLKTNQSVEKGEWEKGNDILPLESNEFMKEGNNETHYVLTLQALLYKRYKFIYRKFMTYLIPSVIALCFLILCIFMGQVSSGSLSKGGPPLRMALSTYGRTNVYVKDVDESADNLELRRIYEDSVVKERSACFFTPNVVEAIVKEGVSNLPFYRHHMVASVELSTRKIGQRDTIDAVFLYNNVAKHSAPISLNLATNAIAKYLLGETRSIAYTNHPFDNINAHTDDQLSEVQISLLWLIVLPLGFLFFLGSFIYFPFVELSTNFTQLQLMCGVWPCVYWLTTFFADFVCYFAFALIMTFMSLLWEPFRGVNEAGTLLLISLLYGAAGIPFSYLFGRKKSFTAAYAVFIILGIMLGVILTVVVVVLEESPDTWYRSLGDHFLRLFYIFVPQFGLTYSGVAFSRKAIGNYNFLHMSGLKRLSVCSREDASACCYGDGVACERSKSYLAVLEPHIWLMIVGAVFYLFVNVLIHNYRIRKACNWLAKSLNRLARKRQKGAPASYSPHGLEECESDGFHSDLTMDGDKTLRVKRLRKSYSGREVVNNVGFDLKKGECLGILGVNGAGKTTTFRMLTREEIKDNGEVLINNVRIDQDEYLKKLGYCPQNDALNFSLSGREILSTMAMLRGIRDPRVVDNYLKNFDLEKIADSPCSSYSGGNKRKLSFAVAIIGLPPFILLDEPTTGVDPSSRRKLWSLIKKIKDRKQNSFILTSHSMTECEALCNDLKIMKEGTIRRQGTISGLKQSINGYSAKFKLNVALGKDDCSDVDEVDGICSSNDRRKAKIHDVDELIAYLKSKYDGEVKDQHAGLLHYYIKSKEVKWSKLFLDFEELKRLSDGFIEDYMVSEASLEDVFLDVAKADEENVLDT